MVNGVPCYLATDEQRAVTVSETPSSQTNWRIMLAAVPTPNVAGLGLGDCCSIWPKMGESEFLNSLAREQNFCSPIWILERDISEV